MTVPRRSRLRGQAGRAAGGGGVAAAQPGGADRRRGDRRADDGGQRVQAPDQQRFPLDLRMPELRALLLVAVDAFCMESMSMNASVPAPGSSGACRASSARNSPPAFYGWATFPQV
jgi:hypothetical protein